ncbi:MAG: RecX family transcriptional regulator [Chloroflexi bacterium]|nr:RecX family transcriptional regulator [Chloroflexota bacterium]
MAGHITALRFQQHTPDRANVYLDGEFAFGLPAVAAARLRIGQFLSDADIARLQAVDAEEKAYDRAVRFLNFRPRSQAEVRRHLAQAAVEEAVIEAVLVRLTEHGYLDDAGFARYWVENREQFRPKGARALRQELRGKGLDSATIETAVGQLDETAGAYEAARPRALRLAPLVQADPLAFRRKLSDFLLRRGFGYEVVREVVARLAEELTDDERLMTNDQ